LNMPPKLQASPECRSGSVSDNAAFQVMTKRKLQNCSLGANFSLRVSIKQQRSVTSFTSRETEILLLSGYSSAHRHPSPGHKHSATQTLTVLIYLSAAG
jgi:hypothetical protein